MLYNIEVHSREHCGMVYRAKDPKCCRIREYGSNDWTYDFHDPIGWGCPLLRVTRVDHAVRVIVVDHKGPLHCDVYFDGARVFDAAGGLDRRHIGSAAQFSIESHESAPVQEIVSPSRLQDTAPSREENLARARIKALHEPVPKTRSPKSWEDLKVGMIINSGEKCGISEHSTYFLDRFKLSHFKAYTTKDTNLFQMTNSIIADGIDVLHIQHEYSLLNSGSLAQLIRDVKAAGVRVILDMHTVTPSPETAELVGLADKVVIHNPEAKNYDPSKTMVVPLATPVPEDMGKAAARERFHVDGGPVIASFGFVNPSKGFMETLNAVKDLKREYPDIRYLLVGSVHPRNDQRAFLSELHTQATWWSIDGNVMFFSEFYPIETVINILQAADVTCLFYKGSVYSSASSSGPARICLAAHRPLIVSDTPTFSEFGGAVLRTEDRNVLTLTETIRQLLKDEEKQKTLVQEGDKFLVEINGDSIARRFEAMYRQLGC